MLLQNVFITRTTTPSAFMKVISPREFIDVVLTKEDEDGTFSSIGKAVILKNGLYVCPYTLLNCSAQTTVGVNGHAAELMRWPEAK